MADLKFFKCKSCGSMVVKLNEGGCSPSCCGSPMQELTANTTDGAKEKHVPQVAVDGDILTAQVGSVTHPMVDKHFIQFIYLKTDKGGQFADLKPGEEPKATFALNGAKPEAVYEYCNLHGLWKVDL